MVLMGLIGLVSQFVISTCLIIYTVFSLVYLHRAWDHIQELGMARTTPGKAVGYLFIPFYNLYWFFVAYHGWTEDFNRYKEAMGADHVKRASTGPGIDDQYLLCDRREFYSSVHDGDDLSLY